jgi:2'-5' RNA ligase
MPFDFTKPQPLADAVRALSRKTPIGAALSSAEWETRVPAALREAAQFSARVESVRAMQEVKSALQKIITLARDATPAVPSAANAGQPGAFQMDRSKFIETIQKTANRLGLRTQEQEQRGGVQDFGGERRLQLIYEQQIGGAQAKAFHRQGQDPDILDAWPAQRLIRVSARDKERDWKKRWSDARAAVGGVGVYSGADMVALKTSPIWRALSRFGRPWPPFDFGSGMGVEEIDREDAEALGLVQPGEQLTPEPPDEAPEASIAGLDPEARGWLQQQFGGQLEIAGDKARWGQTSNAERRTSNVEGEESEEPPPFKRSSTQVNLPPEIAQPMSDFANSIPDEDLYTEEEGFGREEEPHVTALYGLTGEDKQTAEQVRKALAGEGPIKLRLGKLSLFENEKYDVLKVDIESDDLQRINGKLSELPNENDFPDYHPHATIAYLRKGAGKKYTGTSVFDGAEVTIPTLLFSARDRSKVPIPLSP